MKLEDALKQNPYDKTRGSKGAYIRYLRYTVDGWYSKKSEEIYQYYAYSLAALVAGGHWGAGARCGARAVHCPDYPWNVATSFGARGACDSL